jgi:putative Mg2+ transporter-C (MgtC) family protein
MHDSIPFLGRTLQASSPVTAGAVLLRLIVAAVLGAAIGLEREMKRRPAGLRTNMFMCFGSALFTMLSTLLALNGSDPTRIAAQIIAGIGFIGAGSILHSREHVQGVTTAATIFVVAAIGMCAGAGLMIPATLSTVLVLFGLLILGVLEEHVFVRPYCALYQAEAATTVELYSLLDQVRRDKRNRLVDLKMSGQPEASELQFTLEARPDTHHQLRDRLRAAFDTHKIISFSSSEQE